MSIYFFQVWKDPDLDQWAWSPEHSHLRSDLWGLSSKDSPEKGIQHHRVQNQAQATLRQAETSDLGPFAALVNLDKGFLSNRVQRNYMGLKLYASQLEHTNDKIQKAKTQLPLLRSGANAGYCAHSTTKGVGRQPEPTLWLNPWVHFYLHPIKAPAHPLRKQAGEPGTYFHSFVQHTSQ